MARRVFVFGLFEVGFGEGGLSRINGICCYGSRFFSSYLQTWM